MDVATGTKLNLPETAKSAQSIRQFVQRIMCDTSNALVSQSCHMGSHSVTCRPTEVILTPLPQRIAGTHLSTLEG